MEPLLPCLGFQPSTFSIQLEKLVQMLASLWCTQSFWNIVSYVLEANMLLEPMTFKFKGTIPWSNRMRNSLDFMAPPLCPHPIQLPDLLVWVSSLHLVQLSPPNACRSGLTSWNRFTLTVRSARKFFKGLQRIPWKLILLPLFARICQVFKRMSKSQSLSLCFSQAPRLSWSSSSSSLLSGVWRWFRCFLIQVPTLTRQSWVAEPCEATISVALHTTSSTCMSNLS